MNVDAPPAAVDHADDVDDAKDPDGADQGDPGDEEKGDEKEEDHEAAAVGKLIYQTPNPPVPPQDPQHGSEDVPEDVPTVEGDAADIAAQDIEAGPGHGDDGHGDDDEKVGAHGVAVPMADIGGGDAVNSKEFRAHKAIPWCRSDVFQAMLNHNYRENNEAVVTFNDVRSKTFGGLMR